MPADFYFFVITLTGCIITGLLHDYIDSKRATKK